MDVPYEISGAKRAHATYAAKISVLWSILGRRSFRAEAVAADVKKLLKYWRKRVLQLRKAGWSAVEGLRVQYLRNCPPAFVHTLSDRPYRPCRIWHICPWCYARRVEELFNNFARFLPARGCLQKNSLRLLEIRAKLTLSKKDVGIILTGVLKEFQRVGPKKLLQHIKTKGAYYGVSLAPVVIDGQKMWRLRYSILAILDDIAEIPTWITEDTRRKLKITAVKSKKQLISIIGRTCRYPATLMWGDPDMTTRSLHGRRTVRCNVVTGCLRGSKQGAADAEVLQEESADLTA